MKKKMRKILKRVSEFIELVMNPDAFHKLFSGKSY